MESNSASLPLVLTDSTSPSQLQDVTLDATACTSLPYTLGLQSSPQAGRYPDGRVRSMRDQEEQLAALQKENFSLKLRIYFLEERAGAAGSGTAFNDAKVSASKENIEMKVELQSLRKELDGKQSLLAQAAKVIELMEESQQEFRNKCDAQMEALNEEILDLQKQLKVQQLSTRSTEVQPSPETEFNDSVFMYAQAFGLEIPSGPGSKIADGNLQSKINKLEDIVRSRDLTIKDNLCQIEEYAQTLAKLKETLETRTTENELLQEQSNRNSMLVNELQVSLEAKSQQLRALQKQVISMDNAMAAGGEPNPPRHHNSITDTAELHAVRGLLAEREATIRKLEGNHWKACEVIQQFIVKDKALKLELESVKRQLQEQQTSSVFGHTASAPTSSATSPALQISANSVQRPHKPAHMCKDVHREREDSNDLSDTERLRTRQLEELDLKGEEIMIDQLGDRLGLKQSVKTDDQWENELLEKDIQISQLQSELRKRTCNLQGLVNKELWDKNREIERLQKRLEPGRQEKSERSTITNSAGGDTHSPEYLQLLEENKSLCIRIEELSDKLRNTPERDNDSLVKQLKSDNKKLKIDYEEGEINLHNLHNELDKLQQENDHWREVCSALTVRLQELATFLDSLLRSGDTLGILGGSQRIELQRAVNRSLDLTLSVSAACISARGDQSLIQLSSLSEMLDTSMVSDRESFCLKPSCAKVLYKSHLEVVNKSTSDVAQEQATVIATLKQQVSELKQQISSQSLAGASISNRRSSIKSRTLPSKPVEVSESEAWSEPDRNVSLARIGLQEASVSTSVASPLRSRTPKSGQRLSTPSDSDHETVQELQDRVVRLEAVVAEKENRILEGQCVMLQADNSNKEERLKMSERIEEVKAQKIEVDKQLQEAVVKLANSEEKRIEIQTQMEHLVKQIAEQKQGITLENEAKYLSLQEKLRVSEKERESALVDAKVADMRVADMKLELDNQMKQLAENKEIMNETQESLKHSTAQNDELNKKVMSLETELRLLKEHYDIKLSNTIEKIQVNFEKNWVKLVDYEQKVKEFERTAGLLETSERRVAELEGLDKDSQIRLLKVEHSYGMHLQQCENFRDEIRSQLLAKDENCCTLQRKLDSLTLQVSQVSVDRTRVANEKLRIEQELRLSKCNEEDRNREKGEMQLKISELEKLNADLQNKLVMLQTDDVLNSPVLCKSLQRQKSDISDYTSEEGGDADRLVNSSPDLGIESDQGRQSSLEVQTVDRPLLRTLELTKSMGHLLEGDVEQPGTLSKCRNSSELEQENVELRRKLMRTRRTLEEALGQIMAANQRKMQVEKDICRQITKTHGVLRKVRANLESGSESEVKQ